MNRIVLAITGASGVAYGVRLLELLRALDVETHLVMSKAGERTLAEETDLAVRDVRALADVVYPAADISFLSLLKKRLPAVLSRPRA